MVDRTHARRVDGGPFDAHGLLLDGGRIAGRIDGGAGYVNLFAVVGLVARAVFAFGNVNGTVVMTVSAIDLNASISVVGVRPGWCWSAHCSASPRSS